jgi:hypothetical protein
VSSVITILAFTVLIPFGAGLLLHKRIPTGYINIVFLCGLWFIAELYSYVLRVNNIMNAHVSYILTAFEIFFYASFYASACGNNFAYRLIRRIGFLGFLLVVFDYLVFKTPLNTFSLSVEYIILTCFALYLFYEIVTNKSPKDYALMNFVLLFYVLSSFPYFFAWEWLRTSNMSLLVVLANIHSFVHAICYMVIAYILWKSSLSYSVH